MDHSPQQLVHDEEQDVSMDELLRGLPVRAQSANSTSAAAQEPSALYLEVPDNSSILV